MRPARGSGPRHRRGLYRCPSPGRRRPGHRRRAPRHRRDRRHPARREVVEAPQPASVVRPGRDDRAVLVAIRVSEVQLGLKPAPDSPMWSDYIDASAYALGILSVYWLANARGPRPHVPVDALIGMFGVVVLASGARGGAVPHEDRSLRRPAPRPRPRTSPSRRSSLAVTSARVAIGPRSAEYSSYYLSRCWRSRNVQHRVGVRLRAAGHASPRGHNL